MYLNIKEFKEFINESLSSAREKYLNTGLITKDEFSELLNIDKTPRNKFIGAISRFYIECGKDMDFVKSNLETYKALLNKRIPGFISDINSFDSFSDWCEYMQDFSEYASTSQIKKSVKINSKVLLDNDDWFIVQPFTWEASKLYGAGTKWCTTSKENPSKWIYYYETVNANIYYITDKNKPPKEVIIDGKKVFEFEDDYKMAVIAKQDKYDPFELWDATNTPINGKNKIIDWMKSNGFTPSMFKPKESYEEDDDIY